ARPGGLRVVSGSAVEDAEVDPLPHRRVVAQARDPDREVDAIHGLHQAGRRLGGGGRRGRVQRQLLTPGRGVVARLEDASGHPVAEGPDQGEAGNQADEPDQAEEQVHARMRVRSLSRTRMSTLDYQLITKYDVQINYIFS